MRITLLTLRLQGRSPDFDRRWAQVRDIVSQPPESALSDRGLGEAWVAEEAVASAMYCYWRNPTDYRAAVLEAVNTDGDSDSIATITGSVVGARVGIDGVPSRWVARIERPEDLRRVAEQLALILGIEILAD